jgi:hypothetical protein
MRRIACLGAVLLLVGGVAWLAQMHLTAIAADEKPVEHGYMGSKACKACHSKPAKGEQYVKWEASPHAHAYKTLLTDESKAICKKMGIEGAPEEAAQCLKCHVMAYGVKPELLGKKYDKTEGVGCESCHGAAKDWKVPHMKDIEAAMQKGMVKPDSGLCVTCHNEESPTYKPFDYEKKLAPIAHPNPQKAAEAEAAEGTE